MKLNKQRIGDFIEVYNERCEISNLTVNDVSGISRDKEFFEPSKQVGANTSKYKVVPPGYFACNLMHVGRDIVLPISMNHSKNNKIVSPAYTVFKITDESIILKEYFFMLLKSDEKDRFFWFNTDSSIREGLEWEVFCDIEIELPSIEIQEKYVSVYKSMLKNQEVYEKGLEDLKLVCDATIEKFRREIFRDKTQENLYIQKSVGELIEYIDERNKDGSITKFYGININKEFMPTVANVSNVDARKYKVVRKKRFVFSGMQTGRDKTIRIALFLEEEPIIISPAYTTFEIKDEKIILPEYFFMLFLRSESDRYGWFISDSSVRANLDLERFEEILLTIPPIKIQKSIVDIYNAYITRMEINEKLKEQINNICPVLIKGSLEEVADGEAI